MPPRLLVMISLLAVAFCGAPALRAADQGTAPEHIVLRTQLKNEAITPVSAGLIERALREAESSHAQCLIIQLDTPGGLLDSTREIVSHIISARVPVVVYVSPSGARAASAGFFLTLASHVAVMAPATNIGAAHPVSVGGLPIGPQQTPSLPTEKDGKNRNTMEEKVVNDTQAWIRSLAELRGRNADWAALAVSESRSITANEAVKEHVVDFVADDFDDLLEKLDGREVSLLQSHVQLHTADAEVRTIAMWWGERLLGIISNPNVSILLMTLGFFGVLFEFYSPGWHIPGTLGVICFVLGLFGVSVLPVNYAGLALILIGLGLFAAELFVTSYGALTLGGVTCLVLGALMLVDSPTGFMRVSIGVVGPLALAIGLITLFLLSNIVKAHRARVQTGGEDMLGKPARVDEAFSPLNGHFRGHVRMRGEIWQARSEQPVAAGTTVEIVDRQGLTLTVVPHNGRPGPSPRADQGTKYKE